jgi:hypothetical protein
MLILKRQALSFKRIAKRDLFIFANKAHSLCIVLISRWNFIITNSEPPSFNLSSSHDHNSKMRWIGLCHPYTYLRTIRKYKDTKFPSNSSRHLVSVSPPPSFWWGLWCSLSKFSVLCCVFVLFLFVVDLCLVYPLLPVSASVCFLSLIINY